MRSYGGFFVRRTMDLCDNKDHIYRAILKTVTFFCCSSHASLFLFFLSMPSILFTPCLILLFSSLHASLRFLLPPPQTDYYSGFFLKTTYRPNHYLSAAYFHPSTITKSHHTLHLQYNTKTNIIIAALTP